MDSKWLPMSTAPRTGEKILLAYRFKYKDEPVHIHVGSWVSTPKSECAGYWSLKFTTLFDNAYEYTIYGWMELPVPPSRKVEG